MNSEIYSPEQIKQIAKDLESPFDPDLIAWKPQATSKDKLSGRGVAHADPRAYTDRLNEVVGINGWTRNYQVLTPTGFTKFKKGWSGAADTVIPDQGKVFVICTVTIYGVGSHSSTGEESIEDEHALTSAEAQAFKRTCVCFGLGRYLYDLPITPWLPMKDGKFETDPTLPDWAIPKKHCDECKQRIVSILQKGTQYSVTDIIIRGKDKYSKQLCFTCQAKLAKAIKPEGKEISQPSVDKSSVAA